MKLSHQFPRVFNLNTLCPPRNFYCIGRESICLEIGAGKGKHALMFAQNNPHQTLYAIERTSEKFTAFKKISDEYALPNLMPIHADAIHWSAFALHAGQVARCFILYPNPEPKNKNQRFLNMPFFEFLLSRMMVGGQITIASNIADYISECEMLLQEVWHLPYTKRQIEKTSARTHFEIKYLSRGELCQELIITKPDAYHTRFDDVAPLSSQPSLKSP